MKPMLSLQCNQIIYECSFPPGRQNVGETLTLFFSLASHSLTVYWDLTSQGPGVRIFQIALDIYKLKDLAYSCTAKNEKMASDTSTSSSLSLHLSIYETDAKFAM